MRCSPPRGQPITCPALMATLGDRAIVVFAKTERAAKQLSSANRHRRNIEERKLQRHHSLQPINPTSTPLLVSGSFQVPVLFRKASIVYKGALCVPIYYLGLKCMLSFGTRVSLSLCFPCQCTLDGVLFTHNNVCTFVRRQPAHEYLAIASGYLIFI